MGMVRERLLTKRKEDQKAFHLEIKSVNTENRRIEGFASTKFKDRANDIVDPEAFKAAMPIYMQNPIVLLQHDSECPIGRLIDFKIVQDGLFVTIEIDKDYADADETWAKIAQGTLKAFSIGFYPTEWDYDQSQDAYIIRALELVEISIVSIPCNRESLFNVIKAFRDGSDLKTVQDKSSLSIIEVKRHIAYLKQIYATLPKEKKIEIDLIKIEMDNIFNSDEREKLLKESESLSREILIEASL